MGVCRIAPEFFGNRRARRGCFESAFFGGFYAFFGKLNTRRSGNYLPSVFRKNNDNGHVERYGRVLAETENSALDSDGDIPKLFFVNRFGAGKCPFERFVKSDRLLTLLRGRVYTGNCGINVQSSAGRAYGSNFIIAR